MTKIKDIEKIYGIKFNESKNIKLSTWFKRQGLNNMAETLEKVETKITSK